MLTKLIDTGALGQKTGAGFYKKVGKDILRFDPAKGDYVPGGGKADEIVARMLKKPPAERLKLLRESKQPAGAVPVGDPARQLPLRRGAPGRHRRQRARHRLRDALGLRRRARARSSSGRQAGWKQVAQWVKEDIDAGKALCQRAAAGLGVRRPGARAACTRPRARGAPRTQALRAALEQLPVYQRQPFRESVLGAGAPTPLKAGTEVFKNDEVRVWTLDGEVLIASITAKLHLISPAVIEGLLQGASSSPKQSYKGLVIWSPDDVFSAGANLEALMPVFMKSGAKGIAARGEEAAGRDAAHPLRAACRSSRRCAASRSAAAASWRCTARARVARDGKLHRPGRSRRRPDARPAAA